MEIISLQSLLRIVSCRLGTKGLTESCELPVNLWYNL